VDKVFRITLFTVLLLPVLYCGDESDDPNVGPTETRDYRQDMRDFVQDISAYAKSFNPDFVVIPQNGQELLTTNGEETGAPAQSYLNAIDGVGREDLLYGYDNDNVPTPVSERNYMMAFLDLAESNGIETLVTDYCWTQSYVDSSYERNAAKGYISFAADHRRLDDIPPYPATPFHVNTSDIISLSDAENFLYLITSDLYGIEDDFLNAIQGTDYDVMIMDPFFDGTAQFNSADISALKIKSGGGVRLVIAYMSIGEAENYRYYWQPEWTSNPPSWLAEENPDWPGNFKVRYWEEDWQNMIFGNDDSYLRKIIDSGFDGVYLDIIDAFEYFEEQ